MKKVVICDSGLGGLNIASELFAAETDDECRVIYFNAYPAKGGGFNTLPSPRAQEELLRRVFEAAEKLSPDIFIIACNTLSIVAERLKTWYTPPFPVEGIIGAAEESMFSALRETPDGSLLILGTKTTVESGVYFSDLVRRGADPGRIRSLACPGLATLLESDPASPEVEQRIARCAEEAGKALSGAPSGPLCLGLCCTHFAFARPLWEREFRRVTKRAIRIVDPGRLMAPALRAASFAYLSKIGFFDGAQKSMCAYFAKKAPAIAAALASARPDPGLF